MDLGLIWTSADLVSIGEIGKLQRPLSNEQWIKSYMIDYVCQFHKDIIIPTIGCFYIFSQNDTKDRIETCISFAAGDVTAVIGKEQIWSHIYISLTFMPRVHPLRGRVVSWCPSIFEEEGEGFKNAHFAGSDHFHIDYKWSSKVGSTKTKWK